LKVIGNHESWIDSVHISWWCVGGIPRLRHLAVLRRLLARNPVVALLGARQAGKTTLARQLAAEMPQAEFFDLERAADLARLADPELALGTLKGVVVLDEIQRRPDLFPALRVLADRPRRRARPLPAAWQRPTCCARGSSRRPVASRFTNCRASPWTR
jgi:hypothetical protein